MSSTSAEQLPTPDSLGESFLPLAAAAATAILTLGIAAFGPRLYASQRVENAAIAVEIVAVGQAIFAVLAWPSWTRSLATVAATIGSTLVWLFFAGQIAARPTASMRAIGGLLIASMMVLAVARVITPRRAKSMVWAVLAIVALGVPAMLYLQRDY